MEKIKNKIFNKNNTSLIILVILSIALLIIARLLATSQETRQQAAGSSKLFFNPSTSQTNPLQKNINDEFTLDLMLDPANDSVSFIKFVINFDQSKLSVNDASAIQINSTAFPVVFEGPLVSDGRIAGSLSIGSDPTKAITSTVNVVKITFTATSNTGGPVEIALDDTSQALSIGSGSSATDNVLESLEPAFVRIGDDLPTSTTGPTPTFRPTSIPTITPITTITRGPTPTTDPTKTTLTLSLLFHGIGSAGDLQNDSGELSNKIPLNQERTLNVQLVNEDNQLVATKLVTAFYNSDKGTFDSHYVFNDPLPEGDYIVKVKTEPYLRKLMPGFMTIQPGRKNVMDTTELIAGDINGDNAINILDYNILYDCGYGAIDPLPIVNNKSAFHNKRCKSHDNKNNADLNDNGIINAPDYNLFLRELSAGLGQ